jgi:hypothetical protein
LKHWGTGTLEYKVTGSAERGATQIKYVGDNNTHTPDAAGDDMTSKHPKRKELNNDDEDVEQCRLNTPRN